MRVLAVGRDLIGIFVGQLFEVEIAAAGKLHRVRDRLGIGGEEAGHLLGAFEMALGVAGEPEAGFVDGAGVADAGEHILKAAADGIVIEHVVGGEERHARGLGQGGEPVQPLGIAALKAAGGGEIDAAFEPRRQTGQMRLEALARSPRFETHRPAGPAPRSGLRKTPGNLRSVRWHSPLGISSLRKPPCTPALSPRGEGAGLRPSPKLEDQLRASFLPLGRRTGMRRDFASCLKTRSDFPTVSSLQSRP